MPLAILGGLMRFHFCIQLLVNFDGGVVIIINRTRGVLTGSRSAVLMGRVPTYDIFAWNHRSWIAKGFHLTNDRFLRVALWVDRFFVVLSHASHGISILDTIEADLQSHWGLHFGESSARRRPS